MEDEVLDEVTGGQLRAARVEMAITQPTIRILREGSPTSGSCSGCAISILCSAAANLADLIESAIDPYTTDLATDLGEWPSGPVAQWPRDTRCRCATHHTMRKSRWDPNSPLGE